jgi:hypothetical protein
MDIPTLEDGRWVSKIHVYGVVIMLLGSVSLPSFQMGMRLSKLVGILQMLC